MEPQKSTLTAAPEIPEIKLAGVRKKEDRKKGGLGMFGGSAAKGGFSGASGGLGGGASFIARLIAQVGQNIGVFGIVGAVGMAAAGYGRLKAPEYAAFKDAKKEGFAAHQKPRYEGDLSRLPTSKAGRGDSLGMVGSLDGKTQAERDKEAADAAVKAKADADAKAKEEADQKAKDEAAAKGQVPDAAAMAAAAAGAGGAQGAPTAASEPKGMGHGKIGGLSTSLGGAGLSGGGGMSGGIGGSFANNKFDANKLLAMRGAPQASRTSTASMPSYRGIGKGKALRQLDKVVHYSNLARNGANESRSTNASTPFDNATPGGDRITGAGARDGNSPKDSTGSADPTANTPGQGGSALGNGDDMEPCNSPAIAYAPRGKCPKSQEGKSVDPTDPIISKLKMLMMMTAIASLIQMYLVYIALPAALAGPQALVAGPAVLAQIKVMRVIIGALGAATTILGIVLACMGRPILGAIYAAIGAITLIWACVGAAGADSGMQAIATGLMNGVMPMLLGNVDHKVGGTDGKLHDGGGGWF